MRYLVVEAQSAEEIQQKVQGYITAGWEPFGGHRGCHARSTELLVLPSHGHAQRPIARPPGLRGWEARVIMQC
jgi:hypothetical protein